MIYDIPPEPIMLKKQSKQQKEGKEWDIDSIVFWFGNKLPSYLWKEGGWSQHLKSDGYTWQSFLKILSLHKREMILWSRDAISWKEFLKTLQHTIKDPLFKKILTS